MPESKNPPKTPKNYLTLFQLNAIFSPNWFLGEKKRAENRIKEERLHDSVTGTVKSVGVNGEREALPSML